MNAMASLPSVDKAGTALSLYHLLDPDVLANPYPLYQQLRTPLRSSALGSIPSRLGGDSVSRRRRPPPPFSADRTPTPEQLEQNGPSSLNPIAEVM